MSSKSVVLEVSEDGCVISTSWDSTVHVCDERPQHGYLSQPAARSVLLRRAKIPPLDGINELAEQPGFSDQHSFTSFATDSDEEHNPHDPYDMGIHGDHTIRHGHSSVDVTTSALSPHLNLIACAARGMDNSYLVLVWR